MSLYQWILAIIGLMIWLGCGCAIIWSIYAMLTHETTTSAFMRRLALPCIVAFCTITGFVIGFVFGHWWWR